MHEKITLFFFKFFLLGQPNVVKRKLKLVNKTLPEVKTLFFFLNRVPKKTKPCEVQISYQSQSLICPVSLLDVTVVLLQQTADLQVDIKNKIYTAITIKGELVTTYLIQVRGAFHIETGHLSSPASHSQTVENEHVGRVYFIS